MTARFKLSGKYKTIYKILEIRRVPLMPDTIHHDTLFIQIISTSEINSAEVLSCPYEKAEDLKKYMNTHKI